MEEVERNVRVDECKKKERKEDQMRWRDVDK